MAGNAPARRRLEILCKEPPHQQLNLYFYVLQIPVSIVMSTSARDHFNLLRARKKLRMSQEESSERENHVERAEAFLEAMQAQLEAQREAVESYREAYQQALAAEEEAKAEVELCKEKAAAAPSNNPYEEMDDDDEEDGERMAVDGDSHTPDEQLDDSFAGMAALYSVQKIYSMGGHDKDGTWEGIRRLERMVTKDRGDNLLDPRLLASIVNAAGHAAGRAHGSTCTLASSAKFAPPKTLVSDEVFDKTFAFAKRNPERARITAMAELFNAMAALMDAPLGLDDSDKYPEDVSAGLLLRIQAKRTELERLHDEEQEELQAEDEDYEPVHFRLDQLAWSAIESAVRNELRQYRIQNEKELELPHENSAPIARYNPCAHFRFESEQGRSSVSPLDYALANCILRSRPLNWSPSLRPSKSVDFARKPFEYHLFGECIDMDVDGDSIVFYCQNGYSNRGFSHHLSTMKVPCPVNLEEAKYMGEMKDYSTGDDSPWDYREPTKLYEDGKEDKRFFRRCVVDEMGGLVWASCIRRGDTFGSVTGFANADSFDGQSRKVAVLQFDEVEKRTQKKYINGYFDIATCGPCIVGSAGTKRLSIWNAQTALDSYSSSGAVHQGTKVSPEGDEEDTKMPARVGGVCYKGLAPTFIALEEKEGTFASGDLQSFGLSQVVVGPARDHDNTSKAIRVVDLNAGQVTGLFCGSQGDVSIEKQYCVDRFNLLFTADTHSSFVWDVRTKLPAHILLSEKSTRVLGVPGTSAATAFTFGGRMECIECWDLRMPSSHVYTMATGNGSVRNLFWHERSSSLLANVDARHATVKSDSYWEVEEEEEWPRNATHDQSYFGPDRWNLEEDAILQYPFENGSPMGARYNQVASLATRS